MLVLSFAEDSSQQEYVLSKISFFDETVWPDRRHHFVLTNYARAALDESEQNVKGLRRYANRPPVFKEKAAPDIKLKGLELVEVLW